MIRKTGIHRLLNSGLNHLNSGYLLNCGLQNLLNCGYHLSSG